MFYTCLLCLYTVGGWLSYENCSVVDDYNEMCRLCNPGRLHRGYALRIKDCVFCLEDVCYSRTIDFLCSNCLYDKYDQWENNYTGMTGKNFKRDSSLFLKDWYASWF